FPNTPNCSFYQWSWQMFLWLTSPSPAKYGGGEHIFDSATFYDVSPLDGNGDRTFIPHTAGRIPAFTLRTAQRGPNNLPVVMGRGGKLFEVEQPRIGPNGKQLIFDNKGRLVEIERAVITPNRKLKIFDKNGRRLQIPNSTTTL